MWIAARDENTFQFAAENGCNIMSIALRKPFAEVVDLQRMFDAVTKALSQGQLQHPTLSSTCLFEDKAGENTAYETVINYGRTSENLSKGIGEVKDGYPEAVDFETVPNRDEYDPENLLENVMLGSPEQVIEKLERYKAAGVDQFIYGASSFVARQNARRSLELFCDKMIPNTAGVRARTAITIPMTHKALENKGVRTHFVTLEFSIPDAAAHVEIVVALVASSGGRPHARISDRFQDMKLMGVDQVGRALTKANP